MPTAQEIGEVLINSTIYRCKSETCSDSGGCCVLIVPLHFEPPKDCTNVKAFTENCEDPDCEWEEI